MRRFLAWLGLCHSTQPTRESLLRRLSRLEDRFNQEFEELTMLEEERRARYLRIADTLDEWATLVRGPEQPR